MRNTMIGAVMLGLAGAAAQAQITTTHVPGNLAATKDPGCIDALTAPPDLSPPDLALGFGQCLKEDRPEEAAKLLVLLQLRGEFDARRVADPTARQANTALVMEVFGALDSTTLAVFEAEMNRLGGDGAPFHAAFCQSQRAAPPPNHDPKWMIAHGMAAVQGKVVGDGLVPGFDPVATWAALLSDYMHCAP